MAAREVKGRASEPVVEYFPDTQTLIIGSGRYLADGDDVAKNVMVFFAAEEGETGWDEVAAIEIEFAETVLKPFVDAILTKYGVEPEQQSATPAPQA
jgi:hypothetical protein